MTTIDCSRTKGKTKARVLAVLAAGALGWLIVLGPGCGSSSSSGNATADACTAACEHSMSLGCETNCDCSKCAQAPASCSGALDCPGSVASCSALNSCPTPPADCAAFLATLCH